ncbi:MAG: hypothetical protein AB7R69_01060 [Candidatus Babeliales bacterium]
MKKLLIIAALFTLNAYAGKKSCKTVNEVYKPKKGGLYYTRECPATPTPEKPQQGCKVVATNTLKLGRGEKRVTTYHCPEKKQKE